MRRIEIGSTSITNVGLGTWKYDAGIEPLRAGLDAGADWIDTAEAYGNEWLVGETLAARGANVFVATKVSAKNLRPDDLRSAAESSLRKLGREVIDLYQVHWPNDDVPISDTMGAMERLAEDGLIRFIGVCNFSLPLLRQARASLSRHPLVSHQLLYSLIARRAEHGMLETCREEGIAVLAYSPLGHGLDNLLRADRRGALREIAAELDVTPAQVALAWCLRHDHVAVIPKASSRERMAENVSAGDLTLGHDALERLDKAFPCPSRLVARVRSIGGSVLRRLGLR